MPCVHAELFQTFLLKIKQLFFLLEFFPKKHLQTCFHCTVFSKKKLLAPPVIKVTIHFMRRALWLCHYNLDMSFSPKISVKIPFHALHISRIHPGLLWKTALTSHVPHNTDQAHVDKCAGSAKHVLQVFSCPVHVNCSFTAAHTCTKTFTGGSLVQVEIFSANIDTVHVAFQSFIRDTNNSLFAFFFLYCALFCLYVRCM